MPAVFQEMEIRPKSGLKRNGPCSICQAGTMRFTTEASNSARFISRFGAELPVLAKNAVSVEDAGESLDIAPEIWQGIVKGKYIPTKNTLFSLALTAHIGIDDCKALLAVCGYEWDFAVEKDVVVCYLLQQKVFNRPMIDAALAEYKVSNLFLK